MPEAERWPLDFDNIQQGDVFDGRQLSRILDAKPFTYEYSYRMAALQQRIQDELWDRGKEWTVICDRDCLIVLQDGEVPKYTRKRRRQAVRTLLKSHRHLLASNPANMTPEQRKLRDREIVTTSALVAALVQVRPSIQRMIYKRNVPGLPQPAGEPG
jgi:hypothetical protein